MWRSSKIGKGKWLEGIFSRHIRIDAYLFDKAMMDIFDGKIGQVFPFKEVMYRVKTGKQLVWLRKEEVEALAEAVRELDKTVGPKAEEIEEVSLAIRKQKKVKR